MKLYKGFDMNLQCKGYQFEVGQEYTEPDAQLCRCGFHAAETPLEAFVYYPPGLSRYCEVDLDVTPDRIPLETKRVGKKIVIESELSIHHIANAHVKWAKTQRNWAIPSSVNTKRLGVAINTGDDNDENVVATNTGGWSVAISSGHGSAATSTGNQSVASAYGCQSIAANTGFRSAATNTGDQSAAVSTGDRSMASIRGNQSLATASGHWSAAEAIGIDSIAFATGLNSKARASVGCAIVIAERGLWGDEDTVPLIAIKAAIVDGVIIKADTWYMLVNGEFIEVPEEGEIANGTT